MKKYYWIGFSLPTLLLSTALVLMLSDSWLLYGIFGLGAFALLCLVLYAFFVEFPTPVKELAVQAAELLAGPKKPMEKKQSATLTDLIHGLSAGIAFLVVLLFLCPILYVAATGQDFPSWHWEF